MVGDFVFQLVGRGGELGTGVDEQLEMSLGYI